MARREPMVNLHFPDWTSLSPDQRREEGERCQARLAQVGYRLNAVVSLTPRPVRSSADLRPTVLGGLPYVAKDMFDRIGRQASWGGVRPEGPSPAASAEILNRLDAAGGIEVAVSTMTELAYEPSGYNGVRGRTLNPWHPEAVSGGSSSGSASLVAAGAAVLGLGSDTGGSVRIPASCCGVTALKPTHGALPESGAMPLAPSLDTIGLFARSAAELQLVWPVVSASEPEDRPITKAVVLSEWFEGATPGVRRATESGIETLRAVGLRINSASPRLAVDEIDHHTLIVMQAESARSHQPAAFAEGRLSPSLRKRLTKGQEIGDDVLADSLGQRSRLASAFFEGIGDAEIALLPVVPFETPLAAETDPASPSFQPRVLYQMSSYTRFVNLLGLPALSLPCGFDHRGVPIGLQVIGRRHSEPQLLKLAARFQAISDWHGRVPPALSLAG
jgi:aspartyl-tRNA(Asn)/glutamyl-tRNA(Gln) amidotransferase subunit A